MDDSSIVKALNRPGIRKAVEKIIHADETLSKNGFGQSITTITYTDGHPTMVDSTVKDSTRIVTK